MASLTAEKIDHVALYVSDPDAVAARIRAQLPFRVIEETEEFVLIGRRPELGKLTLFRTPGARERGALLRVGIGIPCGTVERTIQVGDGLELVLVPARTDGEVDLDHVALLTADPVASARSWLEYGFEQAEPVTPGVPRVRLGDTHVELHGGSPPATDRPLLNHLGLLVDSIEDTGRSIEAEGIPVRKVVDAESSRAMFVPGPDGIELEYIEHKPSFALA
ncbi:MAG: VOC family protein [Gaiellaceae bacterium]